MAIYIAKRRVPLSFVLFTNTVHKNRYAPWVRYHSTKTVAVSDSMLYNRTTICCHGILAVTSSTSREARWNSRCACVYSTVNLHGDTNKLSPAVVGAAKGNATKDDSSMCCFNGKSLINFVIYCANITYILPYSFTWKCTSNDCLDICHASLSFRPVLLYMFQKCTVKHCYCVQALSFSSPGLRPSCHLNHLWSCKQPRGRLNMNLPFRINKPFKDGWYSTSVWVSFSFATGHPSIRHAGASK